MAWTWLSLFVLRWVQADRVARADQTESVVWNETDDRAGSAAAAPLGAGLFCSSGTDTPSTSVLDTLRAACRPNKRAARTFGAGLLQYKSSSRPTVQNRACLFAVGDSVGRRRVASRRAPLLCRVLNLALQVAHAFDRSGNGAPNVVAGCDHGSTHGGIRPQRQSSYSVPNDIRRCAPECRIGSRSGSARE